MDDSSTASNIYSIQFAEPLIEQIDINGLFKTRLYSDLCRTVELENLDDPENPITFFTKDLSVLNKGITNYIMLDVDLE